MGDCFQMANRPFTPPPTQREKDGAQDAAFITMTIKKHKHTNSNKDKHKHAPTLSAFSEQRGKLLTATAGMFGKFD